MKNKEKIKKNIDRFVFKELGNLLSVDSVEYDKKDERWFVSLVSTLPRITVDEKTDERNVSYLYFRNIGVIQLDKKGKPIRVPNRGDLNDTISSKLKNLTKRVERLIAKASAPYISKLSAADYMLTPVKRIISLIKKEKSIDIHRIREMPKKEKYYRWLKLLEELNLVKIVNSKVTYTNKFSEIRKNVQGYQKFTRKVVEIAIEEKYSEISEVFGVKQLEPYMKLQTSYYEPCIRVNKLIRVTIDGLKENYDSLYGYDEEMPKLKLSGYIDELKRIGAFEKENNYYKGNRRVFQKLNNYKKEITRSVPHSEF